MRDDKSHRPRDLYQHDPRLKRIVDALDSTLFCPREPGLFHWIVASLLDGGDPYFHLADFPAYLEAQRRVGELYGQPASWASAAILNVARIGAFSSDRTIAEYARDVWGITGVR
jgi:starch phosphorylase